MIDEVDGQGRQLRRIENKKWILQRLQKEAHQQSTKSKHTSILSSRFKNYKLFVLKKDTDVVTIAPLLAFALYRSNLNSSRCANTQSWKLLRTETGHVEAGERKTEWIDSIVVDQEEQKEERI